MSIVPLQRLVVDVDAEDGVGAAAPRPPAASPPRAVSRAFCEVLLVAAGAPADDVADGGAEVLEGVGAQYRLADDDAHVLAYRAVLRCLGLL